MRNLMIILFFLISFCCFSQESPKTHEIKTQIGKTKAEVYGFMQENKAFELSLDTVLIDKGEILKYKLKVDNDSVINANRIILFTYFFEEGHCDGVRVVLYGSDSLTALVEKLNDMYRRVGVNVWIDEHVSIGIRIIQLNSYTSKGFNLELYQIDIGILDFINKH